MATLQFVRAQQSEVKLQCQKSLTHLTTKLLMMYTCVYVYYTYFTVEIMDHLHTINMSAAADAAAAAAAAAVPATFLVGLNILRSILFE